MDDERTNGRKVNEMRRVVVLEKREGEMGMCIMIRFVYHKGLITLL